MNYANFYTQAKKMLIDSLVSIWFKGKSKEQEYMRYILETQEPLLAEPVFQSVFPWEESKESFGEHASKLGILTSSFVDALSSTTIPVGLRFPLDRHPYKHQTKSWKTMLSGSNRTIVVTSGTGSGKTECFMIPVLQDLALRNEKNAVQAIFLYPLNALMKSQQKRIHEWCNALPQKITYAIYNGDTEKDSKSSAFTQKYYPQLVTRPQIRETPPQVLFTNPTMLNYMLVRAEDQTILEKSRGKLRWILLDEAHTYTGSSAAELALQIRRVLDAFGVTIDQVNFAVTSATIGDEKDIKTEDKLKTFVSRLTGKPMESIVVIGGKRIIPEMNKEVALSAIQNINAQFDTNITLKDIENLRKKLNTSPVLTATEITKYLEKSFSKDITKSLRLIDVLGEKLNKLNKNDSTNSALLPTRAHYFIRSINGIYACVNSKCTRHKQERINIGNLTTFQNTNCPSCKSQLLEIATCPSCGGIILVGETSTSKGFRMRTNTIDLDNNLFYETSDDLIESEEHSLDEENKFSEETNLDDGYTPFYFAKPVNRCLRHHTFESKHVFNHDKRKIQIADENDDNNIFKSLNHSESGVSLCPHCGNKIGHLYYLRASANQMGRILSTLILDNAEESNIHDADVLYHGKKYITFTDNRQGSALSAMGLNQDVERAWIRASIFHKLSDLRLEDSVSKDLSPEEEEQYVFLKKAGNNIPAMLLPVLKQLEARKNGALGPAAPAEISWSELTHTLENNSDFRKLYLHLNNARGKTTFNNTNLYLKALLVDQFGWIPKRSNSLENMGIIRLVYPELKKAKCPTILLSKKFKNEDWQNYLKICIDYLVRGGRHYMISGEYKDYLTQNTYTSPIYPSNSDLRKNGKPVNKWPVVAQSIKGISEDQSRLVLLLCAALDYNDVEKFTQEHIANINSLLSEAWNFITTHVLEPVDFEHKGYMLDLMGSKVKLQLIEKGYLCPVDNVIVDVTFCGFSPRMNGYIGKDTFQRFKVKKELQYPYFPFKSTELNEEQISSWINNKFQDQKRLGVFSNIQEHIYNQKPIFISAEHSAQQSREDLDRYESEFNNGHLNILSCSTTMEMGVDIGGISEVVMNNVPPKSSNYLQRAGRAGRRNESKALALTFCAPNPIGTYTWEHPKYPITHLTETPLLKMESRQLVQRHVNALLFAKFVSTNGGFRITSQIQDFFIESEGISHYQKFLNYIEFTIDGLNQSLESSYNQLVKDTSMENQHIRDTAYLTKQSIVSVFRIFEAHLDSLNKALKTLQGNTSAACKAIERQKSNFLKTSLLSYLAENSFLPSAGIPTGLVECILSKDDSKNDFKDDSKNPTLHISQAISSYAPGNQVVRNEWIYEPTGIRLKTKYENNTSRYILQNCSNCGYTTITYGKAQNACPKCGKENSLHGIKNISLSSEQRFTEVIEPAAFCVEWGTKPTRKIKGTGSMNFIQPVLLEMEPWAKKTSSAKMIVRTSTNQSEILFYNRGKHGYGYAFCPYCGKMESERSPDITEPQMVGHKHMTTGTACIGGDSNGMYIRRHVLLVGRYQTDFVEIKFYNEENSLETDAETLYSLGVILSRKLTELLGVNEGEIDFGYDNGNHSIFIYDTALGGAGYSTLFREYESIVLDMAYKALNDCDCERSCTKCLIDRHSQWYLNYLNRKKALQWLTMERKSRNAPSEITTFYPSAESITTDFATELYNLSRNMNIKTIKIFIDNNYKKWSIADFPYIRLLKELSLSGIKSSFALNKKIEIENCEATTRTIIMSALFQLDFEYCICQLPEGLKPLLQVTFNDNTTKAYIGKEINTEFSQQWGSGDIYCVDSDLGFSFQPLDKTEILSKASINNNSIMFDTRIKEDCNLKNFFNSFTQYNINNWSKIKKAIEGKNVSIKYSDRYLLTPLGCMILANFIADFSNNFKISIISIKISVAKITNYSAEDEIIHACDNFRNNKKRNEFLKNAILSITNTTPEINDNGYIEHERCLSIKTESEELCIRPDAGIAHGWKPFGRKYEYFSEEDFYKDFKFNLPIYNQKKNYEGILYTISFNKVFRK